MNLKPLALTAVNFCLISLVNAAVVFDVTESANTINFSEAGLPNVSATDLAESGASSLLSLVATGVGGSALELNDGDVPVAYNTDQNTGINPGDTVTVNLDVSTHIAGYTITDIVSIAGGNQRASQGYDVTFTFIDDSTATLISSDDAAGVVSGTSTGFTDGMTYFSNLHSGWSRIEITEDASGILATGVKSIRFDNFKPANRAGDNGYVAYREIDIMGVPTVALVANLSTSSRTVTAPFTVDISFPESVEGLEESDFVVTNGSVTASSLSGSGASYSVEITPTASGAVLVDLPADRVVDLASGALYNVASQTLTTTYVAPGGDQPTVVLSTSSESVNGVYLVDINFSEPVSGLELSDFAVSNAWLSYLTGAGASYSLLATPDETGDVSLSLREWATLDEDGDDLGNSASNELVTNYTEQLSVSIYGPMVSSSAEFELYLTFNEAIYGLEASDFDVTNGVVTSVVEQGRRDFLGRYFIVSVAADAQGVVTLSLPAGAVVDAASLSEGNVASQAFVVSCNDDFSEDWIVDDAAEWTASTLTMSDLALVDGSAQPTGNTSRYTSVIKTFEVKKKAETLTFKQSSVWDNWTVVEKVEPSGAGNAPILVPVADDDYYLLAQSGNDGYHAWHSTDMVTWTKYGQVTAPEHNWVTTAEYKDGLFYIYVDYPNDHTPHLYVDRDLKDGQTGTFFGMVFNDPTSGSDSGVIRDNSDGLFHLISEDYTPVHAPSHAFDSPLATHTSSEDGITGYQPAEHLPPIDRRTTPTGEMGTWNHPHVEGSLISNPISYEKHEPEQDAFGDWTAIKVGEQYYLFGDYHHSDGSSITAARFTSTSIYEEFELVGSMDSGGHPDPTVGFAEGQFYLITQSDDFTSPGPWVDGVQARAGVDIDGDGVIDQWTTWQGIAEQYDHTPNFVRVVSVTPAQLDLSELPAGYGFQFEFEIDDTAVADVSPIIDRVEMNFAPSNFQQWANERGLPAQPESDCNMNSVLDGIEFSIGQSVIPERQSDGRLSVTATNEAIADGLEVQLLFSDDLQEWYLADASTEGVKLLSDTVDESGNHQLVFEIFDRVGGKVFWRLAVSGMSV